MSLATIVPSVLEGGVESDRRADLDNTSRLASGESMSFSEHFQDRALICRHVFGSQSRVRLTSLSGPDAYPSRRVSTCTSWSQSLYD